MKTASTQLLACFNAINEPRRLLNQLILELKVPERELLFELHQLEHPESHEPLTEWLNQQPFAETVYRLLMQKVPSLRANQNTDATTFLKVLQCANVSLNNIVKENYLSPLQVVILNEALDHSVATALLRIITHTNIPIATDDLLKLIQMPELMRELLDEDRRGFANQIIEPNTLKLLLAAKAHDVDLKLLTAIVEEPLGLNDTLNALCEQALWPMLTSYQQAIYDELSITERTLLYRKLFNHAPELFSQLIKDDSKLDEVVIESGLTSIPLFNAIINLYVDHADQLTAWLRVLAAHKAIPLDAFIMLAELGGSLTYLDVATQTHLMHIAAEHDHEELIRFLISQNNTQALSAYHKNSNDQSVIDIARARNDTRLLSLFLQYGYDVPGIEYKPVSPTDNPFEKLYMIFAGGGVKATAYAAAIREYITQGIIKEDMIRGTAGASAGAIAAFLLAIGYPIDEAEEKLLEFDLNELLDYDREKFDMSMFESIGKLAQGVIKDGLSGSNFVGLAWKWLTKSNEMSHVQGLYDIFTENGGGICPGHAITDWFVRLFKEKIAEGPLGLRTPEHITFRELADATDHLGRPLYKELRIVVVNIATGRTEILSKERTPDVTIISALRASVSIPIAFAPSRLVTKVMHDGRPVYEESKDKYIDGGTGINYPFYAFMDKDPKHNHTQGFCLTSRRDIEYIRKGDFFRPYKESNESNKLLSTIFQLMLGPQDAIMGSEIVRENTLFIPMPENLPLWDFGSPETQQLLKALGRSSAIEAIKHHEAHEYIAFDPYTLKLIGKLNCLQYNSHRKEVISVPVSQSQFFRYDKNRGKLLPLEILKLYARAKESEIPYLAQLINPNISDQNGLTALHIAYAFNLERVVVRLLKANANKHAVWQFHSAGTVTNITAKQCKQQQPLQRRRLLGLGVNDYFNDGEEMIMRSEKERVEYEKDQLETALEAQDAEKKQLQERLSSQDGLALALLRELHIPRQDGITSEMRLLKLKETVKEQLKTQHDEVNQVQALCKQKEERLALLEEQIKSTEREKIDLNDQIRLLSYQQGIVHGKQQATELKCDKLSEAVRLADAQLAEKDTELEQALAETERLSRVIDRKDEQLRTVQQQLDENPINRVRWRQHNRYYAQVLLPRLKSLKRELKNEIQKLETLRKNIFFKLLLPLVAFILYVKAKEKENKLQGLRQIKTRLENDNEHSANEIVAEAAQDYKLLNGGLFSRTKNLLHEMTKYESRHCSYDI